MPREYSTLRAVLGHGAWLGSRVAVPPAEPGDDPSGPGEAFGWMRVGLQCCPAPVFRSERGEELDLLLPKSVWPARRCGRRGSCTSCRVMTAALAAIAVSLSNRSAVSKRLSSS